MNTPREEGMPELLEAPLKKLEQCPLGCFAYGQCKANMHGRPTECAASIGKSQSNGRS